MLGPFTEASNEVLAEIKSVMAGGNWFRPLFASLLAEIQLGSGLSADALAAVDRAESGIKECANQFHRLLLCTKADVLLAFDTRGRQDRDILGHMDGSFTEGFNIADLKDARVLLDALV